MSLITHQHQKEDSCTFLSFILCSSCFTDHQSELIYFSAENESRNVLPKEKPKNSKHVNKNNPTLTPHKLQWFGESLKNKRKGDGDGLAWVNIRSDQLFQILQPCVFSVCPGVQPLPTPFSITQGDLPSSWEVNSEVNTCMVSSLFSFLNLSVTMDQTVNIDITFLDWP